MDTLRGPFGSFDDDTREEDYLSDSDGDESVREAPPSPVGQDERRMQVRAYNHWASLLQDRNFPSIEDLDEQNLPDFGPHSVLLDFSAGIENPAVRYLGAMIASECGTDQAIATLDDVPSRSLLSRITDHYMQILANQAPIGFEAEFVNQRGATILYRGILLPFSSDDETIDFIYGVINWKEVADQLTTDELLLEIDQALDDAEDEAERDIPQINRQPDTVSDWADGPSMHDEEEDFPADAYAAFDADDAMDEDDAGLVSEFVLPDLGDLDEEETIDQDAYASLAPSSEIDDGGSSLTGLSGLRNKPAKKPLDLSAADIVEPAMDDADVYAGAFEDGASLPDSDAGPVENAFDDLLGGGGDAELEEDTDDWSMPVRAQMPGDEPLPMPAFDTEPQEAANDEEPTGFAEEDALQEPAFEDDAPVDAPAPFADSDAAEGLYDALAEARELAQVALTKEDRSRTALYDAVSRAYDVSLAAAEAPEDFAELVAENGLTAQERAPMTPVVKLVFGAEYDKTRLTEYAAVLDYAHRQGIARGALRSFLSEAEGGLKGVVQAERRLRREEAGKPVAARDAIRPALAKKLRALETAALDSLSETGPEFGVVMIRRLEDGSIVLVGEVSDDVALVEKVGRALLG